MTVPSSLGRFPLTVAAACDCAAFVPNASTHTHTQTCTLWHFLRWWSGPQTALSSDKTCGCLRNSPLALCRDKHESEDENANYTYTVHTHTHTYCERLHLHRGCSRDADRHLPVRLRGPTQAGGARSRYRYTNTAPVISPLTVGATQRLMAKRSGVRQ